MARRRFQLIPATRALAHDSPDRVGRALGRAGVSRHSLCALGTVVRRQQQPRRTSRLSKPMQYGAERSPRAADGRVPVGIVPKNTNRPVEVCLPRAVA